MAQIKKTDGSIEEFDQGKLTQSLRRSGASEEAARDIAGDIAQNIKELTPTHEIYGKAFQMLSEHRQEAAARYSLKRAILAFGPSGFPFESYLAKVFEAEGNQAQTNQHVQGRCVEHEVDVVLSRGKERVFVEAKFHNNISFKTDLQVALYVEARTEDIAAAMQKKEPDLVVHGLLATNTKFTSLAIQYARCRQLELLGWQYPEERNLHDRVAALGLYPITALASLSREEKLHLLGERLILCSDLLGKEEALFEAGVAPNAIEAVLGESRALSGKTAPTAAIRQ